MHTYRGWHSTKLHLALITMALITAVYCAVGWPVSEFGGYSMAILGAAGIFSGSEVVGRFAAPPPKVDPPV